MAPADFELRQLLTRRSHGEALDELISLTEAELVVILEIECVPMTGRHPGPGGAGPGRQSSPATCSAPITSPTTPTSARSAALFGSGSDAVVPARGDVGQELTYRCEEISAPVAMLWPSFIEEPCWGLTRGRRFGINTEYDGAFLHTFNIRSSQFQQRFIDRCRAILAGQT